MTVGTNWLENVSKGLTRREFAIGATSAIATLGIDRFVLHPLHREEEKASYTAPLQVTGVQHSPAEPSAGDEVTAEMWLYNFSDEPYKVQTDYFIEDPNEVVFNDPNAILSRTIPGRTKAQVEYRWTVSESAVEGSYQGRTTLSAHVGKPDRANGTDDPFLSVSRSDSLWVNHEEAWPLAEEFEELQRAIDQAFEWLVTSTEYTYNGIAEMVNGVMTAPGAFANGVFEGFFDAGEDLIGAAVMAIDKPAAFAQAMVKSVKLIARNLGRPQYLFDLAVQGTTEKMQAAIPDYDSDAKHDAFATGWGVGWGMFQIVVGILGALTTSKLTNALQAKFGFSATAGASAAMSAIANTSGGFTKLARLLPDYPNEIGAAEAYLRRFLPEDSTSAVDAKSRIGEVAETLDNHGAFNRLRYTRDWIHDRTDFDGILSKKTFSEMLAIHRHFPDSYTYIPKQQFNSIDFDSLLNEGQSVEFKLRKVHSDGKEIDGVGIRVSKDRAGNIRKKVKIVQEAGAGKNAATKVNQVREAAAKISNYGLDDVDVGPGNLAADATKQAVVPKRLDIDTDTSGVKISRFEYTVEQFKGIESIQREFGLLEYDLVRNRPES